MEMTKEVLSGIKRRKQKARIAVVTLLLLAILLMCAMLMMGNTFYPIDTVLRVLAGEGVPGANFAIQTIRLPRMLAGALVGFSLGMAGSVFQKMLRNTLASPDIIGISSGTSMAAVFCILILQMSGPSISLVSLLVGLIVALLVYVLSSVGKFSSARFILIGIGLQAIMNALISYMMVKANQYEVTGAMRWLSGSLNGIQMKSIPSLLLVVVFSILILCLEKFLNMIELGEDIAIVLGVRVRIVRILLIICSVFIIAFATSVAGPIAFVSFLAGPIAHRFVGSGQAYAFAAGLVGVILVLCADLIGQFAFTTRFPVGVITGVIGAPYLIFLLIRMNQTRGIS